MPSRRETALAFIEAYQDWDLEAIMAVRDESCVQHILPSKSDCFLSDKNHISLSLCPSPRVNLPMSCTYLIEVC
jgi:hypothetical protein